MLRYPVKLSKDDNGTLLLTARDFPEVATFGDGEAEALSRGVDAIATAMKGRISASEEVPAPSLPRRGEHAVAIPALVIAKLELYRTMLEAGLRKSDLARRLKVHAPQIDRLLDLDHDSRLDQIESAARAMGRELHIELRPAA